MIFTFFIFSETGRENKKNRDILVLIVILNDFSLLYCLNFNLFYGGWGPDNPNTLFLMEVV